MFRRNEFEKKSYSQGGEDLLIDFIFSVLAINKPSYLDIGAHHPFYLSNTALLYSKGSRGISVEPDPDLFKEIKKIRREDICLNIGIGIDESKDADFYLMSAPTLNTFCREEALNYANNSNYSIKKVVQLPLQNINSIIETHVDKVPDFINIDVEGLDFDIIKSLDFKRFRPIVLCVETLKYIKIGVEEKDPVLIDYIKEQGYMIYADTYMNTIFVCQDKWAERQRS